MKIPRIFGRARLAIVSIGVGLLLCAPALPAQAQADDETQEAGAGFAREAEVLRDPEMVEELVDRALRLAHQPAAGNTPAHFAIAAAFVLFALLVRSVGVRFVFGLFQRLANRTASELDNRVLRAVEGSVKALVIVVGLVCALMVLKLPPAADRALRWGYLLAVAVVVLLFFYRLVGALLDHAETRARERHLNVVPFLPWIKRVVLTVVFVFGVLLIAQSLGADVRAFLAGLGIGGLAVALAAQDTLANVFGSIVVTVDQPFRMGEFVKIGAHSGAVEEIGLRSTRLRTAQKNIVTIPNKTVAAEAIENLTRIAQRRVEQTIGLTYDATPAQMTGLVEDIRAIILAEEEVDKPSVTAQFTNFGASSLDIWFVYNTRDPDFARHLKLKQRINIAIMEAVAARGMSFAFPTQTLHVASVPPAGPRTIEGDAGV